MLGKGFLLGAATAAGALMLVPGVAKATARAARPLLRAAVKTGTVAAEEMQKAAAEAYEHFEDLAAEIRAEMDEAKTGGESDVEDAVDAAAAHARKDDAA